MLKRKFILSLTIVILLVFVAMLAISCSNNKTYNIDKAQTSNGSFVVKVEGKESSTAKQGNTVEVVATPNDNYEVQSVYYTLDGKTDKNTVTFSNGKYTFTMPQSDVIVYVTFKAKEVQPEPTPTYTLAKGQTENGSFELYANGTLVTSSLAVEENVQITVKPSKSDNYTVGEVYYLNASGEKVTLSATNNEYTFTMPASNVTVYVDFTPIPTPDSAFEFELSADGSCYILSGFVGSQTDIVIPSTYNGKLVKEIKGNAFSASSITSVFIPNTIETIGEYAFNSCLSLVKVNFESNSNLQTIGLYAFGNTELKSVIIPASVVTIESVAFDSCRSLNTVLFEKGSKLQTIGTQAFSGTDITSITIPASVTFIDSFQLCSSLTTVLFEEGSQLQTIGDYCFWQCNSLTTLIIPQSVTSISQSAFTGCLTLPTIYYCGDAFSWSKISKPTTLNDDVYYYSQTKPTEGNNYWHYDEYGVPTKWN